MNHRAIIKSISRHLKKTRWCEGGKTFGVDYITWKVLNPQKANMVDYCAEAITGKKGRYIPAGAL